MFNALLYPIRRTQIQWSIICYNDDNILHCPIYHQNIQNDIFTTSFRCTTLYSTLVFPGYKLSINSKFWVLDWFTASNYFRYMLIGMGCLVVVLSLVGCLGACLQNHHILACYFVLMLMLILLEIAIGTNWV